MDAVCVDCGKAIYRSGAGLVGPWTLTTDPSDCPRCGEWRDNPTADCANCGLDPMQPMYDEQDAAALVEDRRIERYREQRMPEGEARADWGNR
jgi:hypothetical protein